MAAPRQSVVLLEDLGLVRGHPGVLHFQRPPDRTRIARSDSDRGRNAWLALSIALNLGLLFYFKYTYFLTDAWNGATGSHIIPRNWLAVGANAALGTTWSVDRILLPVGISFYTFQTISYTVDIRRGQEVPPEAADRFRILRLLLPQFVAGPIVRAAEFVPQILRPGGSPGPPWASPGSGSSTDC